MKIDSIFCFSQNCCLFLRDKRTKLRLEIKQETNELKLECFCPFLLCQQQNLKCLVTYSAVKSFRAKAEFNLLKLNKKFAFYFVFVG